MLINHCGHNAYKALWVNIVGKMLTNHCVYPQWIQCLQIIACKPWGTILKYHFVNSAGKPCVLNAYKSLQVNLGVHCLQIIAGKPCAYNAFKSLKILAGTVLKTNHFE